MPSASARAAAFANRRRALAARLERVLARLSLVERLWWASGLSFLFGAVVFSIVRLGGCLAVTFTIFFAAWAVPTFFYALYSLWRRMTYRISVRLFVSYLLIGVLPFPLMFGLGAFAAYVLIGQYASAEFGDVMRDVRESLVELAEGAATAAAAEGTAAAADLLARGPELPAELAGLENMFEWIVAAGDDVRRSAGAAELPVPAWIAGDVDRGVFRHDDAELLAALARRGDHLAVAFVRLGPETARQFSDGQWYQVFFPEDQEEDDEVEETEAGGEDAAEKGPLSWLWEDRNIFFIRITPELRYWSDGSAITEGEHAAFIRTSPKEAATDLFRAPYEIREALWGIFLALSMFFLLVYLGAAGLAGIQVWAITRSTARLTHGTRQVQAGALGHRIPVRRRDQLGDLAVAFNQMTESVAGMLDEVAEKERLKGELELAREIQQSLLPSRHLEHGAITVHAYFRPAAEVGGDYFDLFPLDRGRLLVTAGDVAGHGLSTGLLMAMVKSAVATLIQEGHRGADLLERVNRFMLKQPREHRMVTLAIADVDIEGRTVEITNAAHPPVFVSGGTVREVMLPALPIGFPWRRRPPTERLELGPGSRLVFYSDGLVEAVDGAGEQFGYQRLRALIEEQAQAPAEELLARLLAELERHTGGRALDDDLTILIIDCGAADPGSHPPDPGP